MSNRARTHSIQPAYKFRQGYGNQGRIRFRAHSIHTQYRRIRPNFDTADSKHQRTVFVFTISSQTHPSSSYCRWCLDRCCRKMPEFAECTNRKRTGKQAEHEDRKRCYRSCITRHQEHDGRQRAKRCRITSSSHPQPNEKYTTIENAEVSPIQQCREIISIIRVYGRLQYVKNADTPYGPARWSVI